MKIQKLLFRYFLHLAYKGTDFHGWQVQPNACSVQGELERALAIILSHPISLVGAGRTDTGVHALSYYAHFDLDTNIDNINLLVYKLNSILSKDIVIFSLFPVPSDLHARFSALSRTYEYHIHSYKSPFLQDRSFFVPHFLDVSKMNQAAQILLSYKDFSCFSKSHTQVNNNNCEIYAAYWTETAAGFTFRIQANRFLRNMVRAIVGTLLEVGLGKLKVEEMHNILASKNRGEAGKSVPAKALFLKEIAYDFGSINTVV